ncbi:lichenase [Cellvibrio mixtus]|uniref:Lichenase n=1 Tax=Cellvibrio mixtus TaxID=39650 RepID=A0A266Q8T5_9GAMM|nr:family 16 glycosylhydrolase [Cellvibrio mixtus]OZY86026.1 lichenase [Cellvibrio mixtus]
MTKSLPFLISLSLCTAYAHSEDKLIAYPGYSGNYAGYTLKVDERFNSFNSDLWQKGDGAVGHESSCRFTPQGVQVDKGVLNLIVNREVVPASWSENHQQQKRQYDYSCGELRTLPTKAIKYGRFETRMKTPARASASGYISSLFTYTNTGTPREWEEIDIELEGGRPDKFQANLIYGLDAASWTQTRDWGAWEDKIQIGPVDEWRVLAIEWTPTFIKWYVDGALVKTLDQSQLDCKPACAPGQKNPTPIPDNLTSLMMNFWIPNDEIQDVFGGNKKGNVYPMVTQYDWLRIYQLDEHPLTNY